MPSLVLIAPGRVSLHSRLILKKLTERLQEDLPYKVYFAFLEGKNFSLRKVLEELSSLEEEIFLLPIMWLTPFSGEDIPKLIEEFTSQKNIKIHFLKGIDIAEDLYPCILEAIKSCFP